MKTNKKPRYRSIFWTLILQYGLFTLIVLAAAAGINRTIDSLANRSMPSLDLDADQKISDAISQGSWDSVNIERLAGSGSWFTVLDGTEILYQSTNMPGNLSFSADDIACIPDSSWSAYSVTYTDDSGREIREYTNFRYTMNDSGSDYSVQESGIFQIDTSNNSVIYANTATPGNLTTFTDTQLNYIEGIFENYQMLRLPITLSDGTSLTAIVGRTGIDPQGSRAASIYRLSTPMTIAGYIVIMVLFVWFLYRWFRKPMRMISSAMQDIANGSLGTTISYDGPAELETVAESFNTMSKRLEEAEDQRNKAEEQQTKLITDISHDLKTPITVIQGYAKAINDGVVPQDQIPQYLHTIYLKSNNLVDLINTFHTYSKLSHPDFHMDLRKENLTEITREYFAAKYEEMNISGFELEADLPEEAVYVNLDRLNFNRVLDNILSNALRYNPRGTKILVHLEENAENHQAILTLADSGIGIPGEMAKHIFDPFYTGDASRGTHGSGLGLSIAKTIVEMHQGTIELVPQDGKWKTVFRITLPEA